MKDTEFFERALGLVEPWRVKEVAMDVPGQRVEIIVECQCGTTWANEQGSLSVHGYEDRQWRHLDTMQFETIIRARVPRVRYPDGHTEMVAVPWAQARSRWTLVFEAFALRVLQNSRSLSRGGELLRLDWSSVQRILERAVERGLARRELDTVRHVGLDEKSFGRGQDYVSVLTDLNPEAPRVLEVVEDRDTVAAGQLLESLPPAQREAVEAVAIDLSAAYAAAVAAKLPRAVVVHDRFHLSKLLGEAVDKVRRAENKQLLASGDQRLVGTRYLWLWHPDELSGKKLDAFEAVAYQKLRTARAYYHRIMFLEFWQQPGLPAAQSYFAQWYHEAQRSGLEPIKKAAATFKAHLPGLLQYFVHRITNAVTEAFNATIQSLKANARGFRNFEHYRIRILFFLGRLDLLPR